MAEAYNLLSCAPAFRQTKVGLCEKEILTLNAFLFNQMNCNNLSLNNHTRQAIWTNHPSHLIS